MSKLSPLHGLFLTSLKPAVTFLYIQCVNFFPIVKLRDCGGPLIKSMRIDDPPAPKSLSVLEVL